MTLAQRSSRGARVAARVPAAYSFRRAGTDDVDLLTEHRIAMYRAIRRFPPSIWPEHRRRYRRWLRSRLRTGAVVGYVVSGADREPVASGLLWFQPTQPRPGAPQETTPYVFSMYTRQGHRGHGLATAIVARLVRIARRRGYGRVVLHASVQGRSVYRKLGFQRTHEMRLILRRAPGRASRAGRPNRS